VKQVNVLGIPFHAITTTQALAQIELWLDGDQNHIVVTPNPEGVMQARRNRDFAAALLAADFRLADGVGILLASWLKGQRLPERVRGYDTVLELFEHLCKKGRNSTAYFLGAKPGVAQAAKANMEQQFPCLQVVGCHHGYFEPDTPEEAQIVADINKLEPDILLVCTGMPRAEIWAHCQANINARITMCVGGTLDVMANNAELAPSVMRKWGLEWLYRLYKQPSRFKRMLDIPRFVAAIFFGGIAGC